jgi:hypothetical protein
MTEARYDDFHVDGWWWARCIRENDDAPEIIHVHAYGVDRLVGEATPFDREEFLPLAPIDVTGWPGACDADSPGEIGPGYYWAYVGDEVGPEILRVVEHGDVYRIGKDDGGDSVGLIDRFIRKIEQPDLA